MNRVVVIGVALHANNAWDDVSGIRHCWRLWKDMLYVCFNLNLLRAHLIDFKDQRFSRIDPDLLKFNFHEKFLATPFPQDDYLHERHRVDSRNREDQKIERKPFINRSLITNCSFISFIYLFWMNASTLIMILKDSKVPDPQVLFFQ